MKKRRSNQHLHFAWSVWAELLRLPNLFTVPGDVLVGWVLSGMRGGFPGLTIIASLCLYASGLLWNDCFDAHVDAKERPMRPIPSGRVRRGTVFWVACILASLGIFFSFTGFFAAILLLGLILFYNLIAKHLPWIGVITMGCCRGMNVYLGVAGTWPLYQTPVNGQIVGAILFFTGYIVLVSIIAKHEATPGAKIGRIRFLAPAMVILTVPFFLWFDRGIVWPSCAVAVLMGLFLMRRLKIPELVAGLIRFLIPLQCMWCLAMFPLTMWGVPLFLMFCWGGAILASRRFAGS